MVYHYTSDLQALTGIIQKDNICLWATRYDKLNDPLEFCWAEKHVIPLIPHLSEKWKISYDQEHRVYPYVISLCKSFDNLTLWRLYGNNGLGFQLGLDDGVIKENVIKDCITESDCEIGTKIPPNKKLTPDYFMDCFYANELNINKKLQECWDRFEQQHNSNTNNDIIDMSAFIKTEDYEVENEIRYIRPNYDSLSVTPETYKTAEWKENSSNLKYRTRGKDFVPYQDVAFPKEALKEIVIGYEYKFDDAKQYLEVLLKQNNYNLSEIKMKQSKFYKK
jgi:hypothetical protein